MPSKVLTLDSDLKTTSPTECPRKCKEVVEVPSALFGRNLKLCRDYAEGFRGLDSPGIAEQSQQTVMTDTAVVLGGKRGRGRPKGSTTKRGAKKPKVPTCKEFRTVVGKKGRSVCVCATPGNHQIQANTRCGLPSRSRGN